MAVSAAALAGPAEAADRAALAAERAGVLQRWPRNR